MTDKTYGTADHDAPVTRSELERAVRSLNLSDLELRDAVLQLAARVVALTDEVTRRIDGVEPEPAPPGTPAARGEGTIEQRVVAALPETLAAIRTGDAGQPTRVSLDLGPDKYTVTPSTPPCDELIPLCKARCCRLTFSLSTADLDEGVVRWDIGQPYLIRQRASDGYCVHNDPDSRGCTVHAQRPRVCRVYDCRKDSRVWTDYDNRVPAPHFEGAFDDRPYSDTVDLVARSRARAKALLDEKHAINESYADDKPAIGPVVTPRMPTSPRSKA